MSQVCPNCTQVNQDSVAFCTRCGYRFQSSEQIGSEEATARPSGLLTNVPAESDPSATFVSGSQRNTGQSDADAPQQPFPPSSAPAYAIPATPPNTPAYSVPASAMPVQNFNPAQGGYPPQGNYLPPQQPQGNYLPPQQPQGNYPPQQIYGQSPYGSAPIAAATPGSGLASVQRAFAGKGTPVHQQSWLLDGKQIQPAIMRSTLIENIHKQGVLGINATPEHLREQGVIMEERDYVRVQYGSSSVFVYVAPIGQDLYVSRISTVQQPLSRIRIAVLGGLLVLMLICLIIYLVINPNVNDFNTYIAATNAKTFFSYPTFGLIFFFVYLLLRSLVFFLTDNDFLAYLRPNRLNDFTLDALSLVEQVADKAIRETVKQEGLNDAEITRPAQSYALSQPLHRF